MKLSALAGTLFIALISIPAHGQTSAQTTDSMYPGAAMLWALLPPFVLTLFAALVVWYVEKGEYQASHLVFDPPYCARCKGSQRVSWLDGEVVPCPECSPRGYL